MSQSEEHDGRQAIGLGDPDEEPEAIDGPVAKGQPFEGHGDEQVALLDDIVRLQHGALADARDRRHRRGGVPPGDGP